MTEEKWYESAGGIAAVVVFIALFGTAVVANFLWLAVLVGVLMVFGAIALAIMWVDRMMTAAKLKVVREAGRAVGRHRARKAA